MYHVLKRDIIKSCISLNLVPNHIEINDYFVKSINTSFINIKVSFKNDDRFYYGSIKIQDYDSVKTIRNNVINDFLSTLN